MMTRAERREARAVLQESIIGLERLPARALTNPLGAAGEAARLVAQALAAVDAVLAVYGDLLGDHELTLRQLTTQGGQDQQPHSIVPDQSPPDEGLHEP